MIAPYLYIHWNLNPNIPLPFDWFSVQWYGLMWSLSIISCFYLGKWILSRENLPENDLVLIIQYVFIGAIIGARLGQVFFYQWDYFSANPIEIIKIWNGGLASHGGVLGGLAGLLLFVKWHPTYNIFWILDRTAIIIFVPAALIRLGNLFNSELYGKATTVPWAFVFERVDTVPRHPVVLYESIAYFGLFIGGVFLYRNIQTARLGLFTAYFFTGTFTLRFFLEFFKESETALYFNYFSKTQLLNLPFIFLGVLFAFYFFKKKTR